MSDPWSRIHEPPIANSALDRNERRQAATEIAALAARLPRITLPLTKNIDLDRLRVNVALLVAPELVKWR